MRNRGRMDIRHQLAFLSMSTFSMKQYTRELSNHPHWDPRQGSPTPHTTREVGQGSSEIGLPFIRLSHLGMHLLTLFFLSRGGPFGEVIPIRN